MPPPSLFAASTFCVALFALGTSAAKTNARVLILGGGVAGLQTAYALKQNGIDDILLVEANSRLGGRMLARRGVDDFPYDGQFWEHDPTFPGGGVAGQMLALCNIPLGEGSYISPVYVDDQGNDVTATATAAQAPLFAAFGGIVGDWNAGRLNEANAPSVHAALRLHGWHPTNPVETASEVYLIDSTFAVSPSILSTTYYLLSYGGIGFSANAKFGTPTVDPQSSQTFVDCLKNLVFTENDDRIVLGKTANNISSWNAGVRVTTTQGDVYTADYVVVTFSLGVLQRESVAFSPPLSYAKRLAINEFTMEHAAYVWARFNQSVGVGPFKNQTAPLIIFAGRHRGDYHFVQDAASLIDLAAKTDPNRPLYRIFVVGDAALRVARQPLDVTRAELDELFGQVFGVQPSEVDVVSISDDPLYYGNYRGWHTGATFDQLDVLREPIADRVFFAGDAYHKPLYGRAAILSGNETGSVLARCINGGACEYEKFGRATTTSSPPVSLPTCGASHATYSWAALIEAFVAVWVVFLA